MHHAIEQGFSIRLLNIVKPYTRKLTVSALGLCLVMVAACGSDNKESLAAPHKEAPPMSDAEAVALAKVALSTFPQLPIDIHQTAQQYSAPSTMHFNPAGVASKGTGEFKLKKSAAPAPTLPEVENCAEDGTVTFSNAYNYDESDVIDSALRATIDFTDCIANAAGHGASTTSMTQNGRANIQVSLKADLQTTEIQAADILAKFQDYSHSAVTNKTSSLTLIDGEFGISFLTNSPYETTTMFAASGTINSTATATSLVTYDRFGLVFEQSAQQNLIYIYGNVIADMENAQYRYSLSTIEPMGTVNGSVQGSFLLESGGSKLFIDRINTEEVTLSADYDDDGSIDYSTVIPLPLEDFIKAKHFSSLPL
jgi:hypothetical protein